MAWQMRLIISNHKTIGRLIIFLIINIPTLPNNKMKMLLAGSHLWTMSAPYVVAVVVVVVVVTVVGNNAGRGHYRAWLNFWQEQWQLAEHLDYTI